MLLRPPGTALFKFVLPNSDEVVCEALPKIGTEKEEEIQNIIHFKWDAPITEDPQCVFDKTSTDVSSADDEGPTDPRFKEDWGKLKLSWLIEEDEVNVKDVLIEFYEVLIDLFDSYAFLGIPSEEESVTI
ncbi:hypothetical protein Pmar_PMAR023841 [Perkinsus marinus ATCC 50983]|uniref:Uncharacterized protein n=1 Tax=Perkinsus marinus (strain ATCC 50983 / TXsc) TaxID=423536 RepID=C5LVW8_PERM5|nr:hypothetical protein Pmar_PMAR023841 [Perkinsus marinus ATCC 50983]EEQ99119.1 hypothetical protein Pmar_PMAR023841 [Perkinsus marinus ATCC 50983]|eukprot:XP_002766402.1 hypothetical protein Pmar_PMAR023841 [Perkinsus marinus ATCC 50983]